LVEQHGSDYRARRLSTKDHLVALLYGQPDSRGLDPGISLHNTKRPEIDLTQMARSM
jgi:hypothetical protein